MKFLRLSLWWLAATVVWGNPAGAQSLSADQILQQFNAVIFGNFTGSGTVDGRTVVGGNMTNGASFAVNPVTEAASQFAALTVYGDQTGTGNFNLDSGDGATIAGTNSGSFVANGGGSVFVGGANSGSITSNTASGSVSLLGSNSGNVTLGNGGSLYVGSSNAGSVIVNGGTIATDRVSINGTNNGTVTLNSGGTVKIVGPAGNGTLDGGTLSYGSSKGTWNLNDGATATHVPALSLTPPSNTLPNFAKTFEAPMTALSTQLAALTAGSSVLVSGNNVTLEAHPNSSGFAVLDMSTSVFAPNDTVSVALNGATSFIVNLSVAGCSANCSFTMPSSVHFTSPASYADSLLWNLTDVSAMSFTNEFGGTILAPDAIVTAGGALDGSLVALGYAGTGALRAYKFTGALPAPEPSGLAVIGVGLLGMGLVCRRRRTPL